MLGPWLHLISNWLGRYSLMYCRHNCCSNWDRGISCTGTAAPALVQHCSTFELLPSQFRFAPTLPAQDSQAEISSLFFSGNVSERSLSSTGSSERLYSSQLSLWYPWTIFQGSARAAFSPRCSQKRVRSESAFSPINTGARLCPSAGLIRFPLNSSG